MSLRLIVCDPVFLDAAALPAAAHTHPEAKPTENRFLRSFMALAAGGDGHEDRAPVSGVVQLAVFS